MTKLPEKAYKICKLINKNKLCSCEERKDEVCISITNLPFFFSDTTSAEDIAKAHLESLK